MIESGPVAGLVGSRGLGEVLGYRDVIGVDMGGTTFKAGVITGGTIDYAREPMVERYHYASPKMNIESIGLAGGSIISVDPSTGNPRGARAAPALARGPCATTAEARNQPSPMLTCCLVTWTSVTSLGAARP